jgi:hypothetical protein
MECLIWRSLATFTLSNIYVLFPLMWAGIAQLVRVTGWSTGAPMPSRGKVPFATKFRLAPSQCIGLQAASSQQRQNLECVEHYPQFPIHRNVLVFILRATLTFPPLFYNNGRFYNSVGRIPHMGEDRWPNWNLKFIIRFSNKWRVFFF